MTSRVYPSLTHGATLAEKVSVPQRELNLSEGENLRRRSR